VQLFTVEKGATIQRLHRHFKLNQWFDNKLALWLLIKIKPELAHIKSGTYQIDSSYSLISLLTLFTSGKEHQFSIVFVEGSTLKQWLNQLANSEPLIKTLTDVPVEEIGKKLGISGDNPEGQFFPDTYLYSANSTDFDILQRAHQRMNKVLMEKWEQRDLGLPYESPYEALIMASIIEKETAIVAEQPLISSVFVNRLAKKMRLQTDPTIIYGLGERYQGDIKFSHIREKTPYNTYRIDGLPPTPIAMPGLSAIEASLRPAVSGYYYFVAKGNGEHYFSETLAEHNKAVAKYQLGKEE
jgi:UPF0755 protein